MKIIKKSVIVLCVLSVFMGRAHTDTLTISSSDKQKTTLTLANVKVGQRLIMKDKTGRVLYREPMAQPGKYSRAFDLSFLPKGKYAFELDQGFAILIVPFEVAGTAIHFKKKELFIKPVIAIEDHGLKIGKSPLADYKVKVKIYQVSSTDETIYANELTSTVKGFKKYLFSEDLQGNFRVVCEADGRVFTRHFKM